MRGILRKISKYSILFFLKKDVLMSLMTIIPKPESVSLLCVAKKQQHSSGVGRLTVFFLIFVKFFDFETKFLTRLPRPGKAWNALRDWLWNIQFANSLCQDVQMSTEFVKPQKIIFRLVLLSPENSKIATATKIRDVIYFIPIFKIENFYYNYN